MSLHKRTQHSGGLKPVKKHLKEWLTQTPVLQYPKFHSAASQFVMHTNASGNKTIMLLLMQVAYSANQNRNI